VQLTAFDHALRAWIVGHRLPLLDPIFEALSLAGTAGIIWYIAAIALFAGKRIRLEAFTRFVLTVLLTWLIVERLLKPIIQRERPFVHGLQIPVLGIRAADFSFPSGHAAISFAAAFALSRLVPRARVVWWALAVAIAFSRIYVGVHYPLDVVAGALIGVACAYVGMREIRA